MIPSSEVPSLILLLRAVEQLSVHSVWLNNLLIGWLIGWLLACLLSVPATCSEYLRDRFSGATPCTATLR